MPTEEKRLKPARLEECVLIVEDQPVIAYDLRTLVLEMGYEVTGPVSSVGEAMKLIAAHPPAAALLDIALSSETSFPIARALAERSIPFVFLTGFRETDLPPALAATAVLSKPVGKADLKAALETLFAEK